MEASNTGGILLIHPPLAKACEPPGGTVRLAGALRRQGVACRVWDANLEGQLALLTTGVAGETGAPGTGGGSPDPWTRRAVRHREAHLAALRDPACYAHPDRYRRAVADLNRLLSMAARPWGVRLSLADCEDPRLSPLRSEDLLAIAADPARSPFHGWFREALPAALADTSPACVGFSLNYLSQALTTFAMAGLLRRLAPRLPILLGGGLVTSWLRRPGWRSPFGGLVDELVAGPGEGPLLARFGRAPGDGEGQPDLDGLPLEAYLAPGRILPYSAASGCWWRRCAFCPEVAEGNPYRPLPPARVAADLEALVARYRPVLVHLLDNALSPAQLGALADRPPGAPWYGFARFTPELADPGFVRRLRAAGCVLLKLGLESGDPGVLEALHKGIDLATAAAVLENLRRVGVATYLYLLFGTPAETPAAARRTLAFTAAHAGAIGFLNLAIFNLPAHGPEGAALADGAFYPGDLSLYRPFRHPAGWDRAEVRRFLDGSFRRHPAIAPILRRDPPLFTSSHAPFFRPGS